MSTDYLRRFTDIPALISLLTNRMITLLDPESWDDSNDSHYLARYREKEKFQSVLALCFTQAEEKYHHWRVFANGSAGVCIRFDRPQLLKAVRKQPGIRMRTVEYHTLAEIENRRPKTPDLPFLKRHGFEDENEFRIIYESPTRNVSKLHIAIPLSCIERITLSPWLPPALYSNLKAIIKSIEDCRELHIVRSTLVDNEKWKRFGDSATRPARKNGGR